MQYFPKIYRTQREKTANSQVQQAQQMRLHGQAPAMNQVPHSLCNTRIKSLPDKKIFFRIILFVYNYLFIIFVIL